MATCRLIVTGRVQGVGYRDALMEEARRRGVTGWVRNCRDGSVEAIVQGPQQAIDAVVVWARRGPELARVADVRVDAGGNDAARIYSRFERWPTV
jgi:acylphosphatase